ncbi:hypothetical protein B0H13DRAFT_866624 [Mycena leptocephala]|nr:hypothetical protein B0H13DRAFT_866624 [Mycena leptocephala]
MGCEPATSLLFKLHPCPRRADRTEIHPSSGSRFPCSPFQPLLPLRGHTHRDSKTNTAPPPFPIPIPALVLVSIRARLGGMVQKAQLSLAVSAPSAQPTCHDLARHYSGRPPRGGGGVSLAACPGRRRGAPHVVSKPSSTHRRRLRCHTLVTALAGRPRVLRLVCARARGGREEGSGGKSGSQASGWWNGEMLVWGDTRSASRHT